MSEYIDLGLNDHIQKEDQRCDFGGWHVVSDDLLGRPLGVGSLGCFRRPLWKARAGAAEAELALVTAMNHRAAEEHSEQMLTERDLRAEVERLRSEIVRFRERFNHVDSITSISEQREQAWTAICSFDIYFEQALAKTGGDRE